MTKIAIADSHNDFLTSNLCNLDKLNEEFKKNNIILCNAIFFTENNQKINFNNYNKLLLNYNKYKNINKACIFSFENMDFIDKTNIENFINLSPFSCSLTWNYDNRFGGGALGLGGLSSKGIDIIKFFNDNKIILDTAHLNKKSFWKAIKLTKYPILNSHTSLNLNEHKRNIDIEQTKAIIDSNGFIGITFVRDFYTSSKNFTSQKIFENIDVIAQKFGIENIGIGSDFYGTTQLPNDIKNYDDFINLENTFIQNGYHINDIEKIFSKNFLKFVKTAINI